MISKQSATTTFKQLKEVIFRPPKKCGGDWEGIPHHKLVSGLQERLEGLGHPCLLARYSVSRCGADFAGGWYVPSPDRTVYYGFGVKASNAMRGIVRFYLGVVDVRSQIPVVVKSFCGWRYVKSADVEMEMSYAVDKWVQEKEGSQSIIHYMRNTPVDNDHASWILMEAGRRRVLPWRGVGKADGTFRFDKTATEWGLMSAFVKASENRPAWDQMDDNLVFHQILSRQTRAAV